MMNILPVNKQNTTQYFILYKSEYGDTVIFFVHILACTFAAARRRRRQSGMALIDEPLSALRWLPNCAP